MTSANKILKLAPANGKPSSDGTYWIAHIGPVGERDGEPMLGSECKTYDELVMVAAQITNDLRRILAEVMARQKSAS